MLDLQEKIEHLIKDSGLQVFEVELPRGRTGVLRVFISKNAALSSLEQAQSSEESAEEDANPARVKGITHQDCALVSRRILEFFESSEAKDHGIDSDGWTLEVSSPGINRRLSRESHFQGAIGERVRVDVRPSPTRPEAPGKEGKGESNRAKNALYGILKSFQDGKLTFEEEESGEALTFSIADIREVKTEFKFTAH